MTDRGEPKNFNYDGIDCHGSPNYVGAGLSRGLVQKTGAGGRALAPCSGSGSFFSILCVMLGASAAPGPSHAWDLGLFADSSCSQCSISIHPGSTGVIRAAMTVDWGVEAARARFRITGLPEVWTYSVSAAPGVILYGDPFQSGVRVAIERV